jgi:hypothetical protein
MMFLYSMLLIGLNRKHLPGPLKLRSYRLVAMVWAVILYGTLMVLSINAQLSLLRS